MYRAFPVASGTLDQMRLRWRGGGSFVFPCQRPSVAARGRAHPPVDGNGAAGTHDDASC
ncbi:protein of unknown function [Methylorubrum extorquens]|uniref:Uncharacterized protein n=1 Tax=Methylorubrum extorquens TaxID=408 RepID=A0A2N9AJP5_METEX|nr:protein of unknown function [Methylorubrum extorquens]